MPYIGKSPTQAVRARYYYTVASGATSVTGSDNNSNTLIFSDGEFVDVSLNGVTLVAGTDYVTTTANTIGSLSAMSANDVVEVVVYDVFSVFDGNVNSDFSVGGDLAVTGVLTTTAATVFTGGFSAISPSTISTANNNAQLTLISTDADSSVGPYLNLYRNSSSPADNDIAGKIQFNSRNDNSQDVIYSEMYITTPDVSDGTEDGQLHIDTMVAGTLRSRIKLMPAETVFNENSIDLDFRVESNGNTDALFIDAEQNEVFFFASDTPDGTNRGGAMFQAATNDRANLHLSCTGTANNSLIVFNNGNGTVGTVRVNGSATAFNTSSDYRLKENVDYSWDATTRLKQLKPARFNFIADDTNTLVDGFLAHEVSSIVPEAISGVKDEVDKDGKPEYQGIDQSKLVPLLVKTIQELEARIKTLEDA